MDRNTAIIDTVVRHVGGLLEDHFEAIEEQGASSEKGKAKASFAVEWLAGAKSPKLVTKISFASRTTDETETVVDFDQAKMDFGDRVESVTMQAGDEEPVTVFKRKPKA